MWKRFAKQKIALSCLIFLLFLFALVFSAGLFAHNPDDNRVVLTNRSQPPSEQHLLGTDPSGRDMLSQLVIGTRNSLLIALAITSITCAFGTMFGLGAGYFGGSVDMLLMRLLDTVSMLPALMLVIVVASLMPNYGPLSLILILSAIGWIYDARVIRGKTLELRAADFVRASKSMGTPSLKVIYRHFLPHLLPVIIIDFTLNLVSTIGIESGLSFLGFGLPFSTPSLGTLLNYARIPENLYGRPWLWLPASLLILTVMLSIHCIGQALKRAVDDNI